ncbi:MAG: ABC transporter substrate-binding protein [Alphaproteobacteria bacterium]|nr:ABC transporter substrate-binding protein [Alphaproteobacteria bacterium]
MKSILATSVLFFALSTGLSHAKDTFTISWWGYNGDKLNANIIEPFKKMCDCDIVFETGNNADRLNKLAVRNGKGVDVVFLTDSYSQIGIEKDLFQKIDRSKIPNVNKLWDLAQAPQGDYGPAYSVGRVSIVYDSDKVEPITSWNDLWRKDLANSVSLPGITTTAGPMMVLRAGAHAGVDAYADPDAAFAALEEMKPNIVKNYKTGSEMVNLFSTGEVTVAVAQDFTFASLKEAVPSMVNAELTDGDIATLNTINIPKGAEHVELAHEFINFVLSTPVQEIEAKQGVDAPVNKEVVLTPEEAANWTYGEEEISSLNRIDYGKLNAAKVDWIDRWNEIFGS